MSNFKEASQEVGRGIVNVGRLMLYPNSIIIGEVPLNSTTGNYMLVSNFARIFIGIGGLGFASTVAEYSYRPIVSLVNYAILGYGSYVGIDTAVMVLRVLGRKSL